MGLSSADRKSLPIAKNPPKPSQEFSEQSWPFLHKFKGFSMNSPQKVHANFTKNLGRQILGNTFSGLNEEDSWTTTKGIFDTFWGAHFLGPLLL